MKMIHVYTDVDASILKNGHVASIEVQMDTTIDMVHFICYKIIEKL